MRHVVRLALAGAIGLTALLAAAPRTGAVEYRLQVVSVFESTFVSFLRSGELRDGASGPGLDRLEAALDGGGVFSGAILFDRRVQPVRQSLARAYGGARVVPAAKPAGPDSAVWDQITWEGTPGERSVWLVAPTLRNIQELHHVALRGKGPLRSFQPYGFPTTGKAAALTLPLNFLWAQAERGTAWDKYLSRGLDLQDGLGAVVGVNFNATFPDQVYLIVSHADTPTTYKAVLVWRERQADPEAPGATNPVPPPPK